MYPAHELLARLFLWEREREIRELCTAGANPGPNTGSDESLRSVLGAAFASARAMISRLAHVSHRPAH